jgi:hypothetical protein
MKYIEFFHAAKRHLETCRQLKSDIENNRGNELELLQNLYYLGGYVVECVYKYAIFKEIGFPNTNDVRQLHLGSGGWNQEALHYRISFDNSKTKQYCTTICTVCGKESKTEITDNTAKPLFVIIQVSKHSISVGMDFFTRPEYAQKTWDIPILSNSDISGYPCKTLVEKWCADIRYNKIILDKNEVFDFFDLTNTIFEGVKAEFPPL